MASCVRIPGIDCHCDALRRMDDQAAVFFFPLPGDVDLIRQALNQSPGRKMRPKLETMPMP
jgi:hypothetical protein